MGTKINLEKFTGQKDFNMWKIKMEALLITQGLGNAIEPDFKKDRLEGSSSTTPEQTAEIDKKARSTIILSLGDSVIREVAKERTVAGLWSKLENLYMTKSLANRLYIKKKMFSLRMIEGSSLDEHIDEFNKVCDALETIDEGLSDESKALLLISSLPKSYEHFVDALLYGRQSLSLEEVKSALGTKKLEDKQEKADSESGEGLMARGRPEKREGKGKKQGRSKSKQKQLKCFHCHKEGHFKRDCPERKSKIKDSKDKVGNAAIATDESSYETAEVLIASKENIQVGIGTVSLKMFDGVVREITQVRHVPDLKRNLISVGMLDQMGCIVKAEKGVLRVIKGSMVIMKGNKNNGLYVLNGQTVIGEASVTESGEDKSKLWHLRLGHMSEKGLKELEKKGVFGKDQLNSLGFCEDCILGKASRIKFESAVHTTKEKLGYIHSDLWGPAQVTSLGGCKFFLTFIDDFSRMVWVYALKTKDEVLEKFKRWKVLVENQTNLKVKVLRTDNGLEYCNKLFEDYCENNGILRHKTVTYTPQQNGLAERMNRTLMEKVRCLLIHSKLPKTLWAEALNTACYLVNRSPSTAIGCKTPMELWLGRVADYSKLRIFGCEAYAHVKQRKLEARALKCRFLGYPEGVKGYRLWCTDFKPPKCIISRDVTFNEAEMLNKGRSSEFKEKNPEAEDDKIQFEVEHAEDKKSETPTTEESEEVDDGPYDEEGSESTKSGGNTYQLARDRKRRTIRPPKRYVVADLIAYALSAAHEINDDEPKTYQEAITSKNNLEWKKAMDEEVESLMKNETWKLIKKPEKKKAVSCKWIYKIKEGIPGAEPRRFKVMLVARGFTQREGIDFTEVFSPVMDVKTAFLHGELQEEIIMDQLEGYEVPGKRDYVCLLKKSLYGLKQSPRQWYLREISKKRRIYLLLYVDDMLIACHDMAEIDQLKGLLRSEFEMKDIGPAKKILGVEIIRNRKAGTMFLTQKDYIEKVLVRFGMNESKPVQTPLASHFKLSAAMCPQTAAKQQEMSKVPYSNAVGSLMYAMVLTRPDISHALSVVSRFMSNQGTDHWRAVKWVMRYLRGTTEYGLLYGGTGNKENILVGYVDSDFAGDLDKRRSLTGYLFTLGGCTVNWKATLQNVVALSTTEAEYTAAAEALKEAIWLKGMIIELGAEQDSVEVYCDSQSAIHLSKNQTHHEKTKHIDVKLHFVRLEVSRGAIKLLKINTEENPADMLTKAVPSAKFNLCMNLAGICRN
ncbi:hypothetical protein KPL71_015451 [Citrus sinensis]|uniref:Uncharacterized protein n=1 Tax=Citrus sinensis TaxID=2711 RepID=A0ACB8KJ50_CITSI|nr:hypothetical protein KPL71_015451 [Citrus sinensis]